jgi:hypothetical protein
VKARNPKTVAAPLTRKGRLEVERGFEIAYRSYGAGQRTLIGLRGGPGVGAKYLTRLNEVIDDDTQLVKSSHLTIFENESEPYLAVIRDFLERHR